MSAWQFPSTEFGEPLKLQPQPGSQLQNSSPTRLPFSELGYVLGKLASADSEASNPSSVSKNVMPMLLPASRSTSVRKAFDSGSSSACRRDRSSSRRINSSI